MEDLLKGYALNDGEILSLKLDAAYAFNKESVLRQASVKLLIRKQVGNKWEPCALQIELSGICKILIDEDFVTSRYSDIILKRTNDNLWYLALDPCGNSGEPHQDDNLVIVANSLSIKEQPIQA